MLLKKPEQLILGARFVVSNDRVIRVELVEKGEWRVEGASRPFINRYLIPWIEGFESGQDVAVPLHAPEALLCLRKITYGKTLSYKEFASLIGKEGAWRYAGNLLGKNPVPLLLPCHRVVRSDQSLGGFMGEKTSSIKKELLEFERRGFSRLLIHN